MKTMTPTLRKFALTAHITSSVGWLGAVAGFLALALAGLTSHNAQLVRAAYLAMELTAWFVIVPLSLASLLTGLVQALGTHWGLFRHYWVVAKLLLTIFATVVLLLKMKLIDYVADVAAHTDLSTVYLRSARNELAVHAAGGLVVLLVITALSVFKPWGMTPFGRRKLHEPDAIVVRTERDSTTAKLHWMRVVGIIALALFVLLVIKHLLSGGLGLHTPK